MVQEQHVAAANRLVTSSRILLAAGDDMGSAEMLWGAAMQAIHALYHRNRDGHPHSIRALERIITDPQLQLPPPALARLPMGAVAHGIGGGCCPPQPLLYRPNARSLPDYP